jgi:hypothetical protein
MRRVGWRWGLVALLGFGCGSAPADRYPAPGRVPGAQTLLVASVLEDRIEILARPLDDSPLVLDLPAAERTFLFYTPRTLADLRITAGIQESAVPKLCGGTALPNDATIYELTPKSAALFTTTSYEGLPTAVLNHRIRAQCPCYDFSYELLSLEGRRTWAVTPTFDGLLVVTSSVFLHLDPSLRLTNLGPAEDRVRAAWSAPDQRVILGGSAGELWSGTVRAGLAGLKQIESSTRGSAISHIAGSPNWGGPIEFFFLDELGYFYRRYGGDVSLIRGLPPADTNQLASLLWLGPGQAVALQRAGEGILWFDEGLRPPLTVELWPVELGSAAGLLYTEWTGLLLSTRATGLYQRVNHEWVEIPNPAPDPSERSRVVSAVDLDQGFLELRQRGWLQQWAASIGGYCRSQLIPGDLELRQLTKVTPGVFVASGLVTNEAWEAGARNALIVVRLKEPQR